MTNSAIIEGVVSVSPTNRGYFCIDISKSVSGGENVSVACKLSDDLLRVYGVDKIGINTVVRVVGSLTKFSELAIELGLAVEHLEILSKKIRKDGYTFVVEN